MSEVKLFEGLKNAYDNTTHSFNFFKAKIDSIVWDKVFQEDGETYYCKGDFILMVENINPFEEQWKPSVMFSDNSIIYF